MTTIGGSREGYGLNGLVNGKMDEAEVKKAAFEKPDLWDLKESKKIMIEDGGRNHGRNFKKRLCSDVWSYNR